jgi:hypothetical protein
VRTFDARAPTAVSGTCRIRSTPADAEAASAARDFRLYADEGVIEAVETSLAAGALDQAERLLAAVEALLPGEHSRFLDAHHARLSARLSSKRNTGGVEQRFNRAIELFRELAIPFWLAVSLLEYGEFLESQRRHGEADPLLKEARETFERLHARPWLERVAFAASPPASRVAPTAS